MYRWRWAAGRGCAGKRQPLPAPLQAEGSSSSSSCPQEWSSRRACWRWRCVSRRRVMRRSLAVVCVDIRFPLLLWTIEGERWCYLAVVGAGRDLLLLRSCRGFSRLKPPLSRWAFPRFALRTSLAFWPDIELLSVVLACPSSSALLTTG
jgi:hypothetical protein